MKKIKDYYYHLAKQQGFSARSVFKLKEINERYKLIQPRMRVMDLGAAPGSWSEYIVGILKNRGALLAIDQNALHSSILGQARDNFRFIQSDIEQLISQSTSQNDSWLESASYHIMLSDMAPKTSGNRLVDQGESLLLLELAFEAACYWLKQEGHFVAKVFQSEDLNCFVKDSLKNQFQKIKWFKPKCSRSESSEIFIIGFGFAQLKCSAM